MARKTQTTPGIGDTAVRASTDKGWPEWFSVLDDAGGRDMSHKELVAYLSQRHGVGPWWQQMVANTYEQARGLHEKYQTPAGYQVSVSKTISVPIDDLYRAWSNKAARSKWRADVPWTVRKATINKSMRITWPDGDSRVEVNFYARGDAKAQVTVQHSKLRGSDEVTRMKAYWAEALIRLSDVLKPAAG